MNLISEVRRRNVHRMAVLYVVTAWLIMQAAEVVMSLAALPDWTGQVTLLLLALGFPIALLFSWLFELTPEGLSLEKNVEPGESITHVTGRRLDFVVIALLCATVALFAYDKWWTSGPPIASIAVLPLESLSAKLEHQYLADGMTEVLTATLGQIKKLRVISRTSAMQYRATRKSLPKIAAELKADAIVEGSVQPSGDKVRVTMQLIDGRTDRHLWARSYQRDLRDVLTLQGEIAEAIADEIRITLTPKTRDRFARDRTIDSEALKLWALGNHHIQGLSEESFEKALDAFVEASHLDPGFAEAYAGIAYAYLHLGSWHASQPLKTVLPLARIAAEKAMQLDPDLSEAHFALAKIHWYEWNWDAADREFSTGAALNPSGLWLAEYANFLISMGRIDEAIETAERAVELDPLSPLVYNELAHAHWSGGRNEEARKVYEKSLQIDPDYYQTHGLLTFIYQATGEHDKALRHLEVAMKDLEARSPIDLGYAATSYVQLGRRDVALEILERLQKRMESGYVPGMAFALVYLALEEYDEAIPWLETAYEERDLSFVWFRDESAYPEEIRDDPRIQAILQDLATSEP